MANTTEMTHEDLVKEVQKLRNDMKKVQKQLRKLAKENVEETDENKPKKVSGFAKPMKMSKELCEFLGVSVDTLMARTEVTKEINKYVKEHSLQNPSNKRELILDDKLRTILSPPEDVTLTFFNLQKYMSRHYFKEESKVDENVKAEPKAETPVPAVVPTAKIVKRVVKKVPAGSKPTAKA